MDRDRIVRCVGDAVRLIVADDETVLAMQQLNQNLGEPPVTVIEHADMPGPGHRLVNGREAVHRNQRGRAGGFPAPIELVGDALVIGLEYLPDGGQLLAFTQYAGSRPRASLSRCLRPMLPGTAVNSLRSAIEVSGPGVRLQSMTRRE